VRAVVLIGEGRRRRPLNDDEAVLGTLVARVARRVELVVAGGELLEVLRLDRLLQRDDLLGDDGVEVAKEAAALCMNCGLNDDNLIPAPSSSRNP